MQECLIKVEISVFRYQIRIKELKYFNQKIVFLSSRKYDSGSSRTRTYYPSRIPDSGVKIEKDTGSRIRIRNTGFWYEVQQPVCFLQRRLNVVLNNELYKKNRYHKIEIEYLLIFRIRLQAQQECTGLF